MPYNGSSNLENGGLLLFSGRDDGVRAEGVGIVLSKNIKNSLISVTPVTERILTARLSSKQLNVSVLVAYAPTELADKVSKDNFYKTLTDTYALLPAQDIKLLMGDMNARVGRNSDAWNGVIGNHSFHSADNNNGTRLLDLCALNSLCIGGTMFQHKDIHKAT